MTKLSTTPEIRMRGHQVFDQIEARAISIATQLSTEHALRDTAQLAHDVGQLSPLRLKLQKVLRNYKAQQIAAQKAREPQQQIATQQRKAAFQDHAFFTAMQAQNLRWLHVLTALEQQMVGKAAPLYPPVADNFDRQSQQTGALDAVFLTLHKLANPHQQSQEALDLGCHADIALFPSIFVADAHAAFRVLLAQNQPRAARFLDIGCGGGVKLMLASQFFGRVEGLEYDAGYVAAAQEVQARIATRPAHIFQADALQFQGFGDYDVLYFFQPMKNSAQLIELENRIASMARPGCILIAPYRQFLARSAELGCAHLGGNIFIAGTTQSKGNDLCRLAEQKGFVLTVPIDEQRSASNFWQPILQASHANGFAI